MDDQIMKVVILGDSGVGKTCFLARYISGEWPGEETQPTVGVEFQTRIIDLKERSIKLQCWDTAGQERFRSISRSIYHGAKGLILMYDITNQTSFDNLSSWLSEFRSLVPANVPVLLVGNKCDLDHARVVKKDVADNYARMQQMTLFETSAKDGVNIERAVEHLVNNVHQVMMAALSQGETLGRPTPQKAVPGRIAQPGQSVDLSLPKEGGKDGADGGNNENGEKGNDCAC